MNRLSNYLSKMKQMTAKWNFRVFFVEFQRISFSDPISAARTKDIIKSQLVILIETVSFRYDETN